ncbi:MAG: DUF4176 domain-containing protein [Lactococcus plantarum]|nr:DUF4176 domain-containing protein [Lactococcus plantarum]MDN6085016.1 DUF4176 domain-containing protein [Lactococcus plantarum]
MSEQKSPLPIGSVVQVNGSEQNFMIISQLPIAEIDGKQGYFEFGAVTLPIGLSSQDMFFFNSDDVNHLIYLGYIDLEFQEFSNQYDEIISEITYEKMQID